MPKQVSLFQYNLWTIKIIILVISKPQYNEKVIWMRVLHNFGNKAQQFNYHACVIIPLNPLQNARKLNIYA